MPEKEMKPYEKKLAHKLLEIRKTMPYFQKDTQGFNYKYVAGCAVLESFREIADKLGVLLITEITNSKLTETKVVNDKNVEKMGRIIELDLLFTFLNVETGETLKVPFRGFGEQQDCSKAFGSALTYAERYFLLKFFNVPTDKDDPDTKGIGKEKEEEREPEKPTEEINKAIALGDTLTKSHLISVEEKELWNKKKLMPDSRKKALDYLQEKVHLGERLEKIFYMKIMASGKELSKKESQDLAKEKMIKEYTPRTLFDIKEYFGEELK